ncbi:hypothetical protein [Azohydromonas sediminis]|uniref:hypothetical protein n=1 Tax=Azohydromonas sediminis TaxID=2259674 RepID=UPI001B354D6D|nr:hypothetical protein [Azohydromonas sediminis]
MALVGMLTAGCAGLEGLAQLGASTLWAATAPVPASGFALDAELRAHAMTGRWDQTVTLTIAYRLLRLQDDVVVFAHDIETRGHAAFGRERWRTRISSAGRPKTRCGRTWPRCSSCSRRCALARPKQDFQASLARLSHRGRRRICSGMPSVEFGVSTRAAHVAIAARVCDPTRATAGSHVVARGIFVDDWPLQGGGDELGQQIRSRQITRREAQRNSCPWGGCSCHAASIFSGQTGTAMSPRSAHSGCVALCGLKQELDPDGVEGELDLPFRCATQYPRIEQRRDVTVNRFDITARPAGCLAYRHRSRSAHDLEKFPTLGGQDLPEQLWRRERDARLTLASARSHRVGGIGQSLLQRANFKYDRVHDSTSSLLTRSRP